MKKTVHSISVLVAVLLSAPGDRADDRISVDAKINGQPVHLALDTGFGAPIGVWHNVADQLGLKWAPVAANAKSEPGEILAAATEPTKVVIFGKAYDQVRVRVLDAPSYLPFDIQGFVGWPALKDNPIMLKVAERTIITVDKVPSESIHWLHLHLLPRHSGGLFVEVPGGQGAPSGTILIDTGDANGVRLSSENWRKWKAAHPRQAITLNAYYTPADGLVVREESWADELSLNGLILHGVAVMETSPNGWKSAGSGYIATLGLAALRRLDLVIDGKAGVVYAHSRTDPAPSYEHNRLGAVFVPENLQSDALIAHVATDSPAAIAGIRDGDQLLSIDQLDVTKWRTQPGILPFSRFWTQPAGTKFLLTLKRDDTTIKVVAVLKNILGPSP